jgi:hypothetical protein
MPGWYEMNEEPLTYKSELDQDVNLTHNMLVATRSYLYPIMKVGLAGIVIAFLLIWILPGKYAVTMQVGQPLSNVGSIDSGNQSASLASSALASLGVSSNTTQSNPFSLFQSLVYSRRASEMIVKDTNILQQLFPDQWDAKNKRWVAPTGIVPSAIRIAADVLRLPAWHDPDARTLNDYILQKVQLSTDLDSGTVTIEVDTPYPDVGTNLLQAIFRATNNDIKYRVLVRSTKQLDYLTQRLKTITSVGDRDAVISILTSLEESLMLASVDLPYAADDLDGPTISTQLVSPRPLLYLALGLLLGLAGGWAYYIGSVMMGRLPLKRDAASAQREGPTRRAVGRVIRLFQGEYGKV